MKERSRLIMLLNSMCRAFEAVVVCDQYALINGRELTLWGVPGPIWGEFTGCARPKASANPVKLYETLRDFKSTPRTQKALPGRSCAWRSRTFGNELPKGVVEHMPTVNQPAGDYEWR